jgi:hypothetical protein
LELLQTSPALQEVPHAPQLPRSLTSVMHRPSHTDCPAGHATAHFASEQTSPALQEVPQAPQFFGSL